MRHSCSLPIPFMYLEICCQQYPGTHLCFSEENCMQHSFNSHARTIELLQYAKHSRREPEAVRGAKLASKSTSIRAMFSEKNRNFCTNCCRVCSTTAALSALPAAISPICVSTCALTCVWYALSVILQSLLPVCICALHLLLAHRTCQAGQELWVTVTRAVGDGYKLCGTNMTTSPSLTYLMHFYSR